jgi:hypothetical protein
MKRSVAAVDLSSVAATVRDGRMVAINSADAPRRAELDEAVAEAHAGSRSRRCQRKVPQTPVHPGSWMKRAVVPKDLSRVATAVRDGRVCIVHPADAPRRAKLDEAIAELDTTRRRLQHSATVATGASDRRELVEATEAAQRKATGVAAEATARAALVEKAKLCRVARARCSRVFVAGRRRRRRQRWRRWRRGRRRACTNANGIRHSPSGAITVEPPCGARVVHEAVAVVCSRVGDVRAAVRVRSASCNAAIKVERAGVASADLAAARSDRKVGGAVARAVLVHVHEADSRPQRRWRGWRQRSRRRRRTAGGVRVRHSVRAEAREARAVDGRWRRRW